MDIIVGESVLFLFLVSSMLKLCFVYLRLLVALVVLLLLF